MRHRGRIAVWRLLLSRQDQKPSVGRTTAKSKKPFLFVWAAVIVACGLTYYFLRPPTIRQTAHRALSQLKDGNVDGLWALVRKDERDRYGVTKEQFSWLVLEYVGGSVASFGKITQEFGAQEDATYFVEMDVIGKTGTKSAIGIQVWNTVPPLKGCNVVASLVFGGMHIRYDRADDSSRFAPLLRGVKADQQLLESHGFAGVCEIPADFRSWDQIAARYAEIIEGEKLPKGFAPSR